MSRACAWAGCGKVFEPSRADARYCSASCRAAASRERRKGGEGGDSRAPKEPAASTDSPFTERADLVERLFRVEEKAQDLEEDLAALVANLGDAKALRKELAQTIAAVQPREPSDDHGKLDDEVIAGIEDRLATLEQAPSVDPWPRHLRASLHAIEHRLAVLEGRRGMPDAANEGLSERLETLEGDYAELVRLVMNLAEQA